MAGATGLFGNKKKEYWKYRRERQGQRFGGRISMAWQKPNTNTIARAAWSGVKYLRTLVNSEVHKLDITATGGVLSTTAVVTHLSAIAQSDSSTGRTGNSVLGKYISFKARLNSHASSVATTARLMIICDTQQVGDTAPTAADILESATDPLSHLNTQNVGRFQVLMDKTFQFDNLGRRAYFVKKFININKYHIRWNGTAASDIQRNGMYLLYMSGEAVNTGAIDYRSRIAWHDN